MAWYAAMFEAGPVADLGSGRGFFLEALKGREIPGIGVDTSPEAADSARALGFEIVAADAVDFLATRSDLGGIFASHLIEHLEPARVEDLFRIAHGALRPGGTIVVVTPNVGDWTVLSEVFWLDPSHVRPYPMLLVAAMLGAAGFSVEGTGLRPTSQGRRRAALDVLNRLRFGGQYGRGEAWLRARRA
jgi:O-antigen chain-terminating methyltransferase